MALKYLILLAFFFLSLSIRLTPTLSSALIDELNIPPPPEFPAVVADNCAKNPSLRYCNSAATDLLNIFKSTVVARHLCAESNNSDCNSGFTRIDLRSRPRLAPLYLSFTFFWKYCPLSVLSVDLSNNSLEGSFPKDVLQCSQIHSLDLSHNQLSGEVHLDNLTSLSFLNLSYNRFSESHIEGVPLFKRFNSSSFLRSGLLPEDHRHGLKVTTTLLLLIGVLVSVVSAFSFVGRVMVRRPDLLPWALWRDKFTTAILKRATNGFSEENLVRKGGRGDIYRGTLKSGFEVEIFLQKGRIAEEARRAFERECRVLLELRHKNLAKTIGWCQERELRAIVKERIRSRCSVGEWLMESPPWKQRLKLLTKVIEGICYLQEKWPQVAYDLRTKSILLTEDFEPIISKLEVSDEDHGAKKLVADKLKPEASEGGIEWVRIHRGHLREVIDEKMKASSSALEQIKQFVDIGLSCLDFSTKDLPNMDQIIKLLRKACSPAQVQSTNIQHQHFQKQAISRSNK